MIAYKGFRPGLICRGYQFVMGLNTVSYTHLDVYKRQERYCLEIQESGIENVQILSPFRSEGAASSEQLNETIRELALRRFSLCRNASGAS